MFPYHIPVFCVGGYLVPSKEIELPILNRSTFQQQSLTTRSFVTFPRPVD